jgi:SAM-dependent methyltransferase
LAAILGPATVYILFKPPSAEPVWNIAICLALCTLALGRPLALGLSIATLFAAVAYHDDQIDHIVLRRRDFFGVLAIETDSSGEFYYLLHGRIRHGQQRRSEDALVRGEPSSYYHVTSPIGQVFAAPAPVLRSRPPLAVVGLGVGSLACYGLPGQEVTFYEIDPAIERLARDDRYFTYLRDARAECRVVLGDARLSLAEAPNGHYGLIVVDAFSGDAIPVHLLTHEAIEIYVKKLAPGGVLAFHISNRYVNLVPVLANLATASALVAWEQSDSTVSEEEDAAGKLTSQWVILARSEDDFGPLIEDVRWQVLTPVPELPLWTDHYTSLWGIVEWRGD